SLVYQPVVDLADGKLIGFEALVRWEITKGEFVPLNVFIAQAETTDLADKITFFVLDTMIDELGDLLRNDRSLYVNINITPNNLQNLNFPTILAPRLQENHINAQ